MFGRLISALAVLSIAHPAFSSAQRLARPSAPPFEPVTWKDGEAAGTLGAGCSWSRKAGGPTLLGMSDDRAAVKRKGVLIRLKPAKDARDMGPFTYDRWTGDGIGIVVQETGPGKARGTAIESAATMVVTEAGLTTSYPGTLSCGT